MSPLGQHFLKIAWDQIKPYQFVDLGKIVIICPFCYYNVYLSTQSLPSPPKCINQGFSRFARPTPQCDIKAQF